MILRIKNYDLGFTISIREFAADQTQNKKELT
jgi:hypothetical protein